MNGLKRRVVLLGFPLALIFLASFLAAQGPAPIQCAKECQQIYTDAVRTCHGDQACLAAARAAALACVQDCGLPKKVLQQGSTSKVASPND
jgi:hypothetical protein